MWPYVRIRDLKNKEAMAHWGLSRPHKHSKRSHEGKTVWKFYVFVFVVEVMLRKHRVAIKSGDRLGRQMKPSIYLHLQGSAEIVPAFQVH